MSESKMLIGSLSNDLLRVADLSYRGSVKAATNFWQQAIRWLEDLRQHHNRPYIERILEQLRVSNFNPMDKAQAEQNLMYSVILQNYSLGLE